MREAELAALSAEFFEPEFSLETAVVMLGSPVSSEHLGARTATYLRPDARTLARVEVFSLPSATEGEPPFVEDVVLVLRGVHRYSFAALQDLLGPGERTAAPAGEEGEVGWQVEFPQHGSLDGVVILRWMLEAGEDASAELESDDEVRANEVVLRRYVPGEGSPSATIPAPPGDELTTTTIDEIAPADVALASVPPPGGAGSMASATTPPPPDLDDAMDAGAFLADLSWRIVRPDFDLARAYALVGHEVADEPTDEPGTAHVVLQPRDERLALATLTVRGTRDVLAVRLDIRDDAPLPVALDAFCDRLNATPMPTREGVQFALEATRSRGTVTLFTSDPPQPIVAVYAIEVQRG